ncbi:MAG: HlyD family efflux transporter periplasmic adaptor subunit, partial [Caldilineaceae bacterium]|nr:HlyD family efflux transporter periplasmic adaptor subunit [Caldilineaceae bacterium]
TAPQGNRAAGQLIRKCAIFGGALLLTLTVIAAPNGSPSIRVTCSGYNFLASVQSAQAALDSAAARLVESQVVAPFAGQVGRIDTRLGELTQQGQTLLLLGDTSQMHIVTTDLRETDVVRLNPGMSVEVTFDALPDQIFNGNVTHVAPVSSTDKGSTNYTIHVTVDNLDPSLRWGMTAFVNIAAPRNSN